MRNSKINIFIELIQLDKLPYAQNLFNISNNKFRDGIIISWIKPFREVPIINFKHIVEANSNFNR